MKGADLFILVTYFVTMLAVGLALLPPEVMRHVLCRGSAGELVAGRRFVFPLPISVHSPSLSMPAWATNMVWSALTIFLVAVPATGFATILFARRWRRAGVITPTEFLEKRFSPVTCQVFVMVGHSPTDCR